MSKHTTWSAICVDINEYALIGPITRQDWNLAAAAPIGLAAAIKALDECVDLIETDAGRALQDFINQATGE